MLHESPSMVDIDVDHWRNLQTLLVESAREKRRIVLIHEDGELLKFAHSEGADITRDVDWVDHPHEVAEQVYTANRETTDFVAVFERRAFDRYFAEVQDTWTVDEDVDEYVHRMYATLDEYPHGIVTYPDSARETLGLGWRVGATYEAVTSAVDRFVPPDSTVVFGVFKDDSLWTTLVLGFDADERIEVVTTANPSELPTSNDWETIADEIVTWVEQEYPPCSLGVFTDRDSARAVLSSRNKPATIREIAEKEAVLADPVPEPVGELFSLS